MSHSQVRERSDRPLISGIAVVFIVFVAATCFGWTNPHTQHSDGEKTTVNANAEQGEHANTEATVERSHPAYYAITPFALLLLAIALLPLFKMTEHWWESNRNRFIVALVLGIVTLLYYGFVYEQGGWHKIVAVLEHATMQEYIPFIVLLFALYVISGGIRIQGDVPAHPLTNTTLIGIGGLLASFIGTTGAAMLLIRPLLETNKERRYRQHTVVFFIFVVCNCGGCLLPIGDPPLFLGYLMGVDFLWTMWHLWMPWLVVNVALLAIYYTWDRFFCYPRETFQDIRQDETEVRPIQITGLWPNVPLLLGVIFSVALLAPDPHKPFPGTHWVPWVYLREVVQLGLVAFSLLLGSKAIRKANKFDYHAIVEVAALFIGIFVCMQPAIEILDVKGDKLGVNTPVKAFWATGILSAALDNAPTYVVFFKTAETQYPPYFPGANVPGDNFAAGVSKTGKNVGDMKHGNQVIPAEKVRKKNQQSSAMLIGIALGAVFMGAMSYIGNGPNFMVRAIAEQSGVPMPSFFGYIVIYSVPVLIPVLGVTAWIFLH